MLRSLDIRDILIIDRLELAFQPGLNVLTGETGAGKSILLDALGFVLGWRGRADLVRQGAEQGEVIAEFDLDADHPARAVLEEAGLPQDDTLLLRRINTSEGRKTAWVNDRRCSGEILRALSETLVELHGQHDDRGLLNAREHRGLLDEFAGLQSELVICRKAWRALEKARGDLVAAEEALSRSKAEEEFLRHAVAELDALSPQPGEDAVLDTKRRLMQQAERIRDDIVQARVAVSEGAESGTADALRWLEGVSDQAEGQLDPAVAALGRALVELGEAEANITQCLEALSFDTHELEAVEERLFAIRALARKHDVESDALPDLTERMNIQLQALDRGDAELDDLRKAVTSATEKYDDIAKSLSALRKNAAGKLDKAMAKELAPLKMERAVFTTEMKDCDAGPDGVDAVSFAVATNPGAPAGPLGKIASGGELSRFLLALKVCLAQGQPELSMIFDEIDRGVGGATADAVGRRLMALAEQGQVLVVTHSPQVAALASHHWRVQKHVQAGQTLSTVSPLAGQTRRDEIARMLSGDRITEEARAAAAALMAG
ncbi:MAG: DNA repair protein RecN [Pseudomonadota bacterium]